MPETKRPDICETWLAQIGAEFEKPYMRQLGAYLREQKALGKRIYPPGQDIFAALNATDFEKVRVVILGQDPYHGPGQAHGLCFSVRPGIDVPPSLRNIYKELQADVGFRIPGHGCLTDWANQGVLLLNSVLTVVAGQAGSHQGKGWEEFTDALIGSLNKARSGLVFMLWGSYAQKKGAVLDASRHLLLKAPHPSPLSASRGFFGCRHFSKANEYLVQQGVDPIRWQLPDHDSERR